MDTPLPLLWFYKFMHVQYFAWINQFLPTYISPCLRWWKFSETINSNEPITELYWCWWPDGSYLCSTKRCWFITKTNWIQHFLNFPVKIHIYTSTLQRDVIEASLWEDFRSLFSVSKFSILKSILVCSLVILSCYIVLCSESLCSQNENKIK